MAVYKIVRVGRNGQESVLDSGFGRPEFARIGREKHALADLADRLERMRIGELEHELRINTHKQPDSLTVTEDCRCRVECRDIDPIVRFEVRPI